jgi:hypothetical protein
MAAREEKLAVIHLNNEVRQSFHLVEIAVFYVLFGITIYCFFELVACLAHSEQAALLCPIPALHVPCHPGNHGILRRVEHVLACPSCHQQNGRERAMPCGHVCTISKPPHIQLFGL